MMNMNGYIIFIIVVIMIAILGTFFNGSGVNEKHLFRSYSGDYVNAVFFGMLYMITIIISSKSTIFSCTVSIAMIVAIICCWCSDVDSVVIILAMYLNRGKICSVLPVIICVSTMYSGFDRNVKGIGGLWQWAGNWRYPLSGLGMW